MLDNTNLLYYVDDTFFYFFGCKKKHKNEVQTIFYVFFSYSNFLKSILY